MVKDFAILIVIGIGLIVTGLSIAFGPVIPQYGFVFGDPDTQGRIGLASTGLGAIIVLAGAIATWRRRRR